MTNKQREAIEELKSLSPSEGAIDTVLSLIKEQQEEIEDLKNESVLIKRYFKKCDLIKKKDKVIDLMAEHIHSTGEYKCPDIKCEDNGSITCEDCIKQYFADLIEKE